MAEPEYTEPTNEQLANFLVLAVYARIMPEHNVNSAILERILERNPEHRAIALRRHREFQELINELSKKMMVGELPCEHIRSNGKRCPNYNEPGSPFCGLHKDVGD